MLSLRESKKYLDKNERLNNLKKKKLCCVTYDSRKLYQRPQFYFIFASSQESQQKVGEYKDIASSLHLWMREKLSVMCDRNFPPTLIEMKKLANESNRFRIEEIPPRHRDKQRVQHLYRDLQVRFCSARKFDIFIVRFYFSC